MSDWFSPLQQRLNNDPVLAGRYRILAGLGRGGMGVVLKAEHLLLRQKVAIKLLLPGGRNDANTVARFLREARASVQIKSEHAAKVLDVGSLSTGEPFMVMEFLNGHDLSAELHLRRVLPIEAAVEYVLQACEAVAEAHSLGIIHRDLKPANLFLTQRADGSPLVKVLDFGISKQLTEEPSSPRLTATAAALGTPLYMSPEQLRSAKDTDARADIWSLGVILYELISGEVPFDGDSIPALSIVIVMEEPQPLEQRRADVPAALGEVVRRALRKAREERFQNVGELARALIPFAPARARISMVRAVAIANPGQVLDASPPDPTLDATLAVISPDKPKATFGIPELSSRVNPEVLSTQPDSVHTIHQPASSSSWPWLLGGVGLVAVGAGVFFWRGSAMPEASSTAAPAVTSTAPPDRSSASSTTVENVAPPQLPSAALPATSTASPAASTDGKKSPKVATKAASTTPDKPGKVEPKQAPRASCDPPFTLVDGIKRMKPECF